MIDQSKKTNLNNLDFKSYINKLVHTIDGTLLGTLESIDNDFLIIKKEVINPIYYYIPKSRFNRSDNHALWLDVSETQIAKNNFSTTNHKDSQIEFETITFRLNESIMNNVQLEAKNRMISTNTLISHILKRFVEWDKFEPLIGMIHIPRSVVIELFNKKNDKEIIEMAELIGKNAIYNTVLFMRGESDLTTFLSWIETEMNNHSLIVRHTNEGNVHKYVIKHDLGYKFSLYYKTIIKSIFTDYFREQINFNISDELLLFNFQI